MTSRTKLADRVLPNYSIGEEIMNTLTHVAGCGLGILVLAICIARAVQTQRVLDVVGACVYGGTMIALYSISSIYHAIKPGFAKKVMQVIDHCAIYFLIAGTYTPILLTAFVPNAPAVGWGLLAAEWILAITACTLTAIDLKKYTVFSMVCYVGMGWGIIFFLPLTIQLLSQRGFSWLLAGGITYTVGAIIYGIGSKVRWMHSVFHVFVVMGSLLQFLAISCYVL